MALVPARVVAPHPSWSFVYGTSVAHQQDQRAPLLSGAQWSSLAVALSIEEVQAMVIVGDTPFVTDSIHDARAKARYSSNVSPESRQRLRMYKSGWVVHALRLAATRHSFRVD